jgi:hypothetical protein
MNELAKQISQTEQLMREDYEAQPEQLSFIPLRNLGQFCGDYLMTTKNSLEQITAFFLARHLENLFRNLGTDAFYDEELRVAKQKIFIQFLEALKRVEQNLINENFEDMIKVISEIVSSYVSQINYLNRHFA